MIIFMYSNKACEYQAISCIRSLVPRISKNTKIVYFTIGFVSNFAAEQLVKIPIPERKYPTFHYYKAELSLNVMDMFPDEKYFFFTDTDVLFSRRLNLDKLKCDTPYPLGVFGPHEQPYIWEMYEDKITIFDENLLMQYLNVTEKTIRYQWSCFYAFNRDCTDFFEEYTSLCKNEFLLKRRKQYYPFHDETPFNICLWKCKAQKSLGYIFVNTHSPSIVNMVETNDVKDYNPGTNLDDFGADWEYIHDSAQVMMYHGFKDPRTTEIALNYLLTDSGSDENY
jgi:hypothetical protein